MNSAKKDHCRLLKAVKIGEHFKNKKNTLKIKRILKK